MRRVLPILSILIFVVSITGAYAQYTTNQPQMNQGTMGTMQSPGAPPPGSMVNPGIVSQPQNQPYMGTPGQPGCLAGTSTAAQTGLGPFPSQMAGPTCMQMSSQAAMSGAGPMNMGMMMPCGSIAVDDTTVYVLKDGVIMRYNKSTMQYMDTTPLPAPTAPATPSGFGRGPVMIRPEVSQVINSFQTLNTAQAEQLYMRTIIQSHAGAISWSRIASVNSDHSLLRQFARQIVNDETAVNCKFDTWLRSWYDTQQPATLMANDQAILNQLQNLTGSQFEIAYMRAMITHFSEADALTNAFLPKATHPELRSVASSMATEHANQIQQLRTWMSQWYNVSY